MQATKPLPHVVTPEQPTEVISQNEIGLLASLRARKDAISEQIAAAEALISSRLQEGARTEPGTFTVALKVWEQRHVQWRQVCERKLGSGFVTRVLAATRPSVHSKLEITTKPTRFRVLVQVREVDEWIGNAEQFDSEAEAVRYAVGLCSSVVRWRVEPVS